jgi:uncharacterized membrane protein
MAGSKGNQSDVRIELTLGILLRVGVVLAAGVVLFGGVLALIQHSTEPVKSLRIFHSEPPELRHPVAIVRDAFRGDALGVIQFGLLLLLATPIARVLFSVFAFVWERDSLYVLLTLVVLAILLASLFFSRWLTPDTPAQKTNETVSMRLQPEDAKR